MSTGWAPADGDEARSDPEGKPGENQQRQDRRTRARQIAPSSRQVVVVGL
jgi:hypothetical protein